MQNFYRNSSPFTYNNIYRKNLYINNTPLSPYSRVSTNNSMENFSNTIKDHSTSNRTLEINNSSNQKNNLPPNKDFILELFGLKLYFDDVLILSLLFFLYKEDVKDEGLFLSLVLLLIS